jgi:hypothetical protein
MSVRSVGSIHNNKKGCVATIAKQTTTTKSKNDRLGRFIETEANDRVDQVAPATT